MLTLSASNRAVISTSEAAKSTAFSTKAVKACTELGVPRLLLGGGVIANARLREVAAERTTSAGIELRIPPLQLCTDNGAMIAALAAQLISAGHEPSSLDFGADSTLPVTEIQVY